MDAKLIRNKLDPPAVGWPGITRQAADRAEYIKLLRRKAIEEGHELADARGRDRILAEMADMYAVLEAFAFIFGFSNEEVLAEHECRLAEKGNLLEGLVWEPPN